MEKFGHIINYLRLLACILVTMDRNVYACLNDDSPSASSKIFLFIAAPSVNATLGEEVLLKCSVNRRNSTLDIDSISIRSRRKPDPLNATCGIFESSIVACSYTIPKVELWHRGTYDCINIDDDGKCLSKTLELFVSEPPDISLVTLRSLYNTTKRVTQKQDDRTTSSCGTSRIVTRHWKETVFTVIVLGILLFQEGHDKH